MKLLAKRVHRFLIAEDGPTAIEYAVMLVLIIAMCVVAISSVGAVTNQSFSESATRLTAAS
jgi:pilus assembly protein Flp/PilA